ncbi:ImmA/IrrE family metallo-endopeptidase [Litorihabitans aurantiacus]|uniref:IrrE N-terminal-like domain-containing protein n=1 Tax=Litorihabitans aurantiacus TaxID=1930061 RepID=A0AA37XHM9_9MICO|nr:ImmA/IrrE family metallo-endopeptidase [Litorihabitans aurantiacus]GMA33542.1 hypothetical protein GCM10025875_35340 [Litorihabitans aurantiacus]GMA33606.1 hypothetical protein GCM10025875_35980 [Litorihabitans aurantiacus]
MLVKDKARQDAREVLDETWSAGYPVDPERIATHLGIIVRRTYLEDGVSGLLRVEPGRDAEIFVSATDTEQRQRFTIAHELGHYWERTSRGDTDFNIVERRGGKYDLHEFYADEFAGALLMPEHQVRDLVNGGAGLARLVREFDLSVPAVRKRLDNLAIKL